MDTAQTHVGLLDLVLQAGPLVKMVMLILFLMSVSTWAIIFLKRKLLITSAKQNEDFLTGFWGGWSIDESFTKAGDYPLSPIAKSFQAAVRELRRTPPKKDGSKPHLRSDVIIRALKKSNASELAALEYSLGWLASTASSAPFIGLFGTVWGIMNSFQAIGASGNASLAAVAPGISEALIATAIGLAAAIPAAIAYNFLVGLVRGHATELEAFSHDFLNLLERESVI
jgi:biopolymer transport protein TolQ